MMIDLRTGVLAAVCLWLSAASTQSALAQAAIVSGNIISGRVDVSKPPTAPIVSLEIEGVAAEVDFAWQGPSGEPFYQIFYGGSYSGTTSFRGRADDENSAYSGGILGPILHPFDQQVPNQEAGWSPYAEPGTWRLTGLRICQDGKHCAAYPSTALPALFPRLTFNLINPGTADILAPSLRSGVIETRSISLASGLPARVFLSVSDAVSGVGSAEVCADNAGQTASVCMTTITPRPIHAGAIVPSGAPFPNNPTGIYTINYIAIRDVAGNSENITDPVAIAALFNNHATITVTP